MEPAVNEVKPVETAKEAFDRKLELVIVIMLGVTALFTAWATWIGSLHGGNQATNYTRSNNLSADGNARWNEASQLLMQDYLTYNELNSMVIDRAYAIDRGDDDEVDRLEWKIEELKAANMTESFLEAYEWSLEESDATGTLVTPFDKEGYIESYYEDAQAVLDEAEAILSQGEKDNANGDAYGLVTVIYTVVLFVLGIVSTFNGRTNRIVLTGVAVAAFVGATIYMLTIPMPAGFNLMNYITGG